MAKTNVILTFDLPNEDSSTKRDNFAKSLKDNGWEDLDAKLTTTFKKKADYDSDKEQSREFKRIEDECLDEIRKAKKDSEVKKVELAIHVGTRAIHENKL